MSANGNNLFWLMQDYANGSLMAFSEEHLAMHAAEKIVGNQRVTFPKGPAGAIMLYGPMDGSTRIEIIQCTRNDLLKLDVPIPA